MSKSFNNHEQPNSPLSYGILLLGDGVLYWTGTFFDIEGERAKFYRDGDGEVRN